MSKTNSLIGRIPVIGNILKKSYKKLRSEKDNYHDKLRRKKAKIDSLIHPFDIPIFAPNSAGHPSLLSKLTKVSANQTIPLINLLYTRVNYLDEPVIYTIEEFATALGNAKNHKLSMTIENKFNQYGSDKSSRHNYHLVYSAIFQNNKDITGLLEIGLGTNNTKVASNMGVSGMPGASLRAFRDILPNAFIYGADYDKGILFEEERIKTFFVDQTRLETFDLLDNSIKHKLDIIIDDGLHAPNANLTTFLFALKRMRDKKEGIFIIEDIPEVSIPIWKLISNIIKDKSFEPYIIKTKSAYMFVCIKK